ncbi:hypothetical protein COS70_04520 [Candidatus Micrarchaeota archaeon CG06_land_8_20_14_3_00_50_6]|nr:MAG: hypothetical protein COS70_04520 [Candidatus Micrarchaeota archaeon CG06_land_8_20_14_3_00_50_6]
MYSCISGAVAAVPANLSEMAAFNNKNQQRQKILTCIAESNESEFWLDFCKEVELINEQEHLAFIQRLLRIRWMLCSLLALVNNDNEPKASD